MKTQHLVPKKPRNKAAALNQAAYISMAITSNSTRKENLMKNQEALTQKIEKLNGKLSEIQKRIADIDESNSEWEQDLNNLSLEFSLTEAEIQENQSKLLRGQIASLKQKAGIQETEPASFEDEP